jgi:hypothetical protein
MTLRILPSAPGAASTSWISSNTIRLVVPVAIEQIRRQFEQAQQHGLRVDLRVALERGREAT